MNFTVLGRNVNKKTFGSKAYWINWLYKNGYKVPKSIFFAYYTDKTFLYDNLIGIFKENDFCSDEYAIRSSSTIEDSFNESKAGKFLTYLGKMSFEEILTNYENVKKSQIMNSKGKMGVIIQELIEPLLSGVIFSSNPINYSKNEVLVSYAHGLADKLVSGKTKSIDLIATIDNNIVELSKKNGQFDDIIIQLVHQVKKIEKILNFPVDVEWAINKNEELIFLQCRPITGFMLQKNCLNLITEKEINNIPNYLISSDKVKLRLLSEKNNILISKAYLLAINCGEKKYILPDLNSIVRSEFCRGYSVVLISPKKIDQKVMRAFVGDKKNVKKSISCHRYVVRAMSDYENLESCIENFIGIVKRNFWVCSIIIQEIFDPLYTGILTKKQDNYIIELGKGHFVSKGIIPMSRYIIEKNEITSINEVEQENYISIIEGCTLEFHSGYDSGFESRIISLSKDELLHIVDSFKYIGEENEMIEFGILKHNNKIIPYLIDTLKEDIDIDINDTKKGIICHGKLKGKIVKLKNENSDSLNFHYYNDVNINNRNNEKVVFVAKLPDISYMNLLSEFDRNNIGFIFESGSVLCHFAILLREKGIPSIMGYNIKNLKEGESLELDI